MGGTLNSAGNKPGKGNGICKAEWSLGIGITELAKDSIKNKEEMYQLGENNWSHPELSYTEINKPLQDHVIQLLKEDFFLSLQEKKISPIL